MRNFISIKRIMRLKEKQLNWESDNNAIEFTFFHM